MCRRTSDWQRRWLARCTRPCARTTSGCDAERCLVTVSRSLVGAAGRRVRGWPQAQSATRRAGTVAPHGLLEGGRVAVAYGLRARAPYPSTAVAVPAAEGQVGLSNPRAARPADPSLYR